MTSLAPVALEFFRSKNVKEQSDMILDIVLITLRFLDFAQLEPKLYFTKYTLLHKPTFVQG